MARRFGGVGMTLVSAATATCGLLMLGGVGPSAGGTPLEGEPVPTVAPTSPPGGDLSRSAGPTTTTPVATTTTTVAATTTTPVATTTTTTEPTTTTTEPERPAPVPLSVSASQQVVGAGGVVTFDGRCPANEGVPLGPVVVWIVGQSSEVVQTGITAEAWTYVWPAPVEESEFSTFTFQFWCGDPTGYDGGYPAHLQKTIDMVAAAPVTTTSTPLVESEPPVVIIPETD